MKKLIYWIVPIVILAACRTEAPEYPFRIRVVETKNDVRVPVRGAEVLVRPNVQRSNVQFEGVTNSNGEVSFVYEYDALFGIQVFYFRYDIDTIITIDSTGYPLTQPRTIIEYDTLDVVQMSRGCGWIKLREDEEAYEEVEIFDWTPEVGNCF
jgi:hypothetical protein